MTKDKYLFICERNASKFVGLFAEQIEIEVMFFFYGRLRYGWCFSWKKTKSYCSAWKTWLKFIRNQKHNNKIQGFFCIFDYSQSMCFIIGFTKFSVMVAGNNFFQLSKSKCFAKIHHNFHTLYAIAVCLLCVAKSVYFKVGYWISNWNYWNYTINMDNCS